MNSSGYLLERRLKELDPDLHRRLSDNVVVCRYMLRKYKQLFPEYTDHSLLHSLTVIEACNNIIGEKQIYKLNEDEIFVLLMSCYLHDSGMGISKKDYDRFKDQMGEKEYFEKHPDDTISDFVRTYHNEFSGLFITRYAKLFDLPSEEHLFAIRQVSLPPNTNLANRRLQVKKAGLLLCDQTMIICLFFGAFWLLFLSTMVCGQLGYSVGYL